MTRPRSWWRNEIVRSVLSVVRPACGPTARRGFQLRAAQSGSLAAANAALSCYIIACARTLADGSGIAPPPLRPQDAGEARRSVEQGPPKRGRGAPTCWGSDREGGRSGRRPHASVSGRIPIASDGAPAPPRRPPRFTGMRPRRRAGPRHRHLCRTRIFRSGPGRGKCLATAPPIPTFGYHIT